MNSFQKIWQQTLDILFPKKQVLLTLEQASWQNLRGVLPKAGNELSAHNIFPLFDYRNILVRTLVWDIKYKHNPRLADALAKLLYEEMLEILADMELFEGGMQTLLVPIPMSKERRRERGFNQTELLASFIHKQSGTSLMYDPTLLSKIRHTKSQAKLTRAERLENLKGAFSVITPERIKQRNIILIDDVSTTGATIREAALTLKKAGAREIIAFTIAH